VKSYTLEARSYGPEDRWLRGIDGGVDALSPAFSADGEQVAYLQKGPRRRVDLRAVRLDGGGARWLTENPRIDGLIVDADHGVWMTPGFRARFQATP